MAIPDAVKRQGDKADEMLKKLAEGTPLEIPQETPPEPAKETPIEPKEPEKPKGDEYDTLKGKYDKEVPRLHAELRAARETIANLNHIIAQMSQRPPAEEKRPDENNPAVQAVNPEDYEDLGEEFVQLAQLVNSQAAELMALKSQSETVSRRVAASVESDFFNELGRMVGNWREVNESPEWLDWLNDPDELTGIRRDDLLREAQNNLDARRVAKFFTAFAREGGRKPDNNHPARRSLNDAIVPDSGQGDGPVDPNGPTITREQYSKAAQDAALKKISMEEFQKISAQFQRAIRDGKIK